MKYREIQSVLDDDLRNTLSHLEMEERAAVSALDSFMERNRSLIQDIEQELARLMLAMDQTQNQAESMVNHVNYSMIFKYTVQSLGLIDTFIYFSVLLLHRARGHRDRG